MPRLVKLIALVVFFGTYTHDYLSGTGRVCFYETVYGERAVSIDAMMMCPLTWEFEE